MRKAKLTEIKLPNIALPDTEPELDTGIYAERLAAFAGCIRAGGADAAIIYADREHCANLAWISGFDPRFEEALFILVPDVQPMLLTGPENQGPAKASPIGMDVRLYPPMGLMGQDRSATPPLAELFSEAGLAKGMSVAACGWKYFSGDEFDNHQSRSEIPSYIVDTIREIVGPGGRISNAGAVLMNPENGLRATNDIDQLARFEYAACHTSSAISDVVRGAQPGMREYDVARLIQPVGIPLTCHTMCTSGPRAWHGLLSPSSRIMQRGDPVTTAYGVQGALNCRAGWLADGPEDLPQDVRDYVEVLVAPYFETIVEWLETIGLGIPGGELDAIVRRRLGPFFGVQLNPGHLIHLEEWMHTPIFQGSDIEIRSGMALQVDVIPATGTAYFTSNVEDGIAILDEPGRAAFAEKYPAAMQRIAERRAFMADQLGIRLKPEVLPFSNISGWLPPFWLRCGEAMAMR